MIKPRIISAIILSLIFPVTGILITGAGLNLLWLIPPSLILILFAFLSIDKFLILTVFLVPLSVQLRFLIPETTVDLFLPTELMLAAILVIMVYKSINGEVSRRLLKHPVTIIILLSLVWGIITSLTGTMIVVSLKSIAAKLWFIAGFYLLAASIFDDTGKIKNYFGAYLAGMTPVAIFFLFRMINAGGFNQDAAYALSRPFFNDHTSFGASIAFCLPVIIYFITSKGSSILRRLLMTLLLLIFIAAIILSYSRAAWLSLMVSCMFLAVLTLKISWKIIVPLFTAIIIAVAIMWQPVVMKLDENRQASSSELPGHLRSITNITTDASNMERINRWKSALRMFRERPLFGWGPATYQFQYAPFQMAGEKTEISTTFGERGNAHSEYLGLLAESGIPGLILYLAILVIVIFKGVKLYYYYVGSSLSGSLLLSVIAGLMTYVVHGGLNNFLDTDKISALFWGMTAVIVALDIRQTSREEDQI
jgi:putative inorganic carbon (hco3(-)) transporter